MQKNTDTLGWTRRSNSTGRGIPGPAGTPDTCQHQAGRQSTIVMGEKLSTRRNATEMNMVSLRDSLVDVLPTLLYVGAQLLIDTANLKNVTLNLDFAKSVTNLPKTQKEVFRDGKKIE